jgi:hypothetical protein
VVDPDGPDFGRLREKLAQCHLSVLFHPLPAPVATAALLLLFVFFIVFLLLYYFLGVSFRPLFLVASLGRDCKRSYSSTLCVSGMLRRVI